MTLPPDLLAFVELFNREAYWESHEALEAPWRENGSGFYKGLILLASAFVHAQRNNPHGIDAQLRKAERELGPYRPAYLGLDVDALLAHAAGCRALVARRRGEPDVDWDAAVPRLRLEPDARRRRGDEPELRGPAN